MSDSTEDLWNAITTRNTQEIVKRMREAQDDKSSLAREWEDEIRNSRRHRSWDEQAADDAGVPLQGPI